MYLQGGGGEHAIAPVWRSESSLQSQVSPHHLSSRGQIQVLTLSGKGHCHLPGSTTDEPSEEQIPVFSNWALIRTFVPRAEERKPGTRE